MSNLSSEDGTVRMFAARALGERRHEDAADPLLMALHDSDWRVRGSAAVALARMYQPEMLTAIVRVARDDDMIGVRRSVSDALIRSGDAVAARLGSRYRPLSIGTVGEMYVAVWSALTLIATAAVLYVVALAGARYSSESVSLVPSVAVVGVAIWFVGVLWGYAAVGVSGLVERILLIGLVPSIVWMGWWSSRLNILRVVAWTCAAIVPAIVLASTVGYAGIVLALRILWAAPWLLLAACALTLGLAWWGRGADKPEGRWRMRVATLVGAAAFYVGYGVGWAALWRL